MVQRRSCFCFLHEAPFPIWIRDLVGPKNLNSDVATEPSVARLVNLSHASNSNQFADLVRGEKHTGGDEKRCSEHLYCWRCQKSISRPILSQQHIELLTHRCIGARTIQKPHTIVSV